MAEPLTGGGVLIWVVRVSDVAAAADSAEGSQQAAFTALDTLYRRLRDRVQNELDRL